MLARFARPSVRSVSLARFNSHAAPAKATKPAVKEFTQQATQEDYYQLRSPYAKWDDPQNRRNFNEPVSDKYDFYEMWTADVYTTTSDKQAVRWFLTYVGVFAGACYGLSFLFDGKIAMPRNYPYGGLARELGARNAEEAEIYRSHIDKSAPPANFD
ncbi:hypothetical protein BABINDRAFT_174361 [Babjeviella inositovora NRRL Y-12698]|uniref:Uncharacterized protein n=1 Tax=Babjeviella inositovora NRRL Y-12698 TaxID=984486 RepID=A0A1E3QVR7_9ASCO|nr:uncharacterized protein BABINDRAFT_174361 [Babjeviella inositovora NRRL Y-12698]ODQ81750.1 hypothetical protein BABINDRAFT_174361 [Babjeviella inositovora NRRL Y-12698]